MPKKSHKIILTADETLMNHHPVEFASLFSTGGSGSLYPSIETKENGEAVLAPYGLRKVEAALMEYGFDSEEIIVTTPNNVERVLGSETKVIGISVMNPLGGQYRRTFTKKRSASSFFQRTMDKLRINKWKPKIIVGGSGAWQLESDSARNKLGIDSVMLGEAEVTVGPLFEKAIAGEEIPAVVNCEPVSPNSTTTIKKPAIGGLVQIGRGCGRGCRFCSPTLRWNYSFPLEDILREVNVYRNAGVRGICLHSENVLAYGYKGIDVNHEAVMSLFESVLSYGIDDVSITNIFLASIVQDPELISEITKAFKLREKHLLLPVQADIDTGSARMIKELLPGKVLPFSPDEWPDVVSKAFGILSDNKWFPISTIILGLPGETKEDVIETIALVNALQAYGSIIIPIFFVDFALEGKIQIEYVPEKMSAEYLEILKKCWKHNFSWIPRVYESFLERDRFTPALEQTLRISIEYLKQEVSDFMNQITAVPEIGRG